MSRRSHRCLSALLGLLAVLVFIAPALAAPPSGEALQKVLARFEAYAEKNRQAFGVPGMAIAVVAGDKVAYVKGLGTTALGGGRPVDGDTIFQVGSTSKAFTAALVAMLADEKKLSWDDQVIKHHPSFLMSDPWVTREFLIKDLMAQHTGLPPHAGEMEAFLGYSREQMIASLEFITPVTSFRSAFAYQNIPFLVSAAVASRHTGLSYGELLSQKIFGPLGMSRSSLPQAGVATGDNATRLHQRIDGKTVLLPADWPYASWVYVFGPAGGINSSAKDMTQWLRLHINRGEVDGKRLISQANVDFLHTPATPVKADLATGQLMQYCQAWVYERHGAPYTMVWHNGDTTANHAMIAFMPGQKAGLVMLSNLGGVDMLDELARYFCDLYNGLEPKDYCGLYLAKLKKADGESEIPPRPKKPQPSLPLERYVGTYFNSVYKNVQVQLTPQGLEMVMGPNKARLILTHWDRGQFTAQDTAEPKIIQCFLSFGTDPAGKVVDFRILGLEHEGGGLFTRVK
ncbi:MAG: serine hydrolase [Proteobacteria bacterium]|nr:serine hydrolase [Pseudomonadota bacterium]MBU1449521.1 serine hydrolase [Pseudomonadota bacterium]MBU2468693.1 serine hydrolase [Pseudomonadota bacterium]